MQFGCIGWSTTIASFPYDPWLSIVILNEPYACPSSTDFVSNTLQWHLRCVYTLVEGVTSLLSNQVFEDLKIYTNNNTYASTANGGSLSSWVAKNAVNCSSTCELQDTWTSTLRKHISGERLANNRSRNINTVCVCISLPLRFLDYTFWNSRRRLWRAFLSQTQQCNTKAAERIIRDVREIIGTARFVNDFWTAFPTMSETNI